MTETAARERKPLPPTPAPAPSRAPKPLPPTPDQAGRLAQQPAQDAGVTAPPQVGVTAKKPSRFSLPFKNPFAKSEATKAREAEANAKKEKLLQSRAAAKKQDVEARLRAKRLNQVNAAQTAKVKAGFGSVQDKVEKPQALVELTQQFEEWLGRERAAREEARAAVLAGREPTPELEAEADLAAEEAAEAEWESAPIEVRAFRPLRFDDFDRALNEVKQMLHESRSAEIGEVGALLHQNEKTDGPVLTPQQATTQLRAQGELERRQVRAAQKRRIDPAQLKADDHAASQKRGEDLVQQHAGPQDTRRVNPSEAAWTKADAEQADLKDSYGHLDKTLLAGSVATGASYAAKVPGAGITTGVKGLTGAKLVPKTGDSAIAGIVGESIDGVSGALRFIGQLLTFVDQISDIKKGVADATAKVAAVRTAVQGLTTLAGLAKSTMSATKFGIEAAGQVAGTLGSIGLPVVSLITDTLNIIDGALELAPVAIRLGNGVTSVDEALLEQKFPLAAAYGRINSRNAQLVEKASWKIAKSGTQLGLSIAEVATGGGMGALTGTKIAVSVVDVAHTLGHTIYDTLSESKASDARKGFFVKHEEGASRDVFKHDIAASVDFLIVSARKGATYAEKTLVGYGVTATEVRSMPAHLLREKILKGLDASGDPKTVSEKFDSAKKQVKEFFGMDTAIRGKDERTALEKVGDYAAAPFKAVAKLPGVIEGAIVSLVDKHRDAQKLIDAKNTRGLKGNTGRGFLKKAEHMIRSRQSIEKSFAKVRQDMADDGLDTTDMRTTADTKERAEKKAEQVERSRQADSSYQIDQAFVDKVTKADLAGLYAIWDTIDKNDKAQIGNLQFFKHEVDKRLVQAGGVPTR